MVHTIFLPSQLPFKFTIPANTALLQLSKQRQGKLEIISVAPDPEPKDNTTLELCSIMRL